VILNSGGGAAVDKNSGSNKWGYAGSAGFGSPKGITYNSQQIVLGLSGHAMDASTGALLPGWNFGGNLADDPEFYGSDKFYVGGCLYQIGSGGVTSLWSNSDMGNAYSASVVVGDYAYGLASGGPYMNCVSLFDGSLKWSQAGIVEGSVVASDGKLIILTGDGKFIVLKADSSSYNTEGRAPYQMTFEPYGGGSASGPRACAVLANGYMYCRDYGSYQQTNYVSFNECANLVCLNFGAGSTGGPGVVQFGSSAFSVGQMAGSARITLTRTNGIVGAIAVNYATANGTGLAVTDYVATTGTLNFATDQASQSFTVPILNAGVAGPDKTINLTLYNPTGGASLGSPTNAVLTIINDNGAYRMKLGFTGYNRPETLTNFPALVILSTNLPGFSYSQLASANGYDLRFSSSDNSQELNYEIEKWNTNGNSCVWVQVPQLQSGSYIWASWGNADSGITSAPAVYTTNGAVWPTGAFAGVWHMAQASAVDSTANKLNGTAAGNITNAIGLIGGAEGVAGGYVKLADSSTLDFTAGSVTLSGWVKFNTLPNGEQAVTRKENQWALEANGSTAMRSLFSTTGTSGWTANNDDTFSPALSAGRWYYLACTYNGSQLWNFENGLPIGASPHNVSGTINVQSGTSAGLGGNGSGADGLANAVIDEVRIEQVYRSTNWIWATYMTVASNASFCVYGSAQAGGGNTNNPITGIPPAMWIQQYFPGTPTNNYASLAASEGNSNGMTVWQDYVAGLNPTNSQSCFSVIITNVGGQIVVGVPSVQTNSDYAGLNRYYEIDQCTNLLTGGIWQPASGCTGVLATGGILACTNAAQNQVIFYRAKATLQ